MMNKNMNESLLKSFDNIMFQQKKMDLKAYIFIAFLGIIFHIINRDSIFQWSTDTIYLVLIAIPLLFSLLPITLKLLIDIIDMSTYKSNNKHNIFYCLDIYSLDKNKFEQVLDSEYNINDLTKSDKYLIDQILINAKILKSKINWHGIFLLVTISVLIEKFILIIYDIGIFNNI